jgi:hypothetical protein
MQGTLTMRRRSTVVIAVAVLLAAGVTAAGAIWSTRTGAPARPETAAAVPGWRVALDARSAALNQRYGLGGAAQGPAATSSPEWYTALMVRSAALNRKYAVTGTPCVVTCEVRHG